jgi:Asp-tRNA(Asn)/Glu-tRNA(Gln) amidotransferase A subunit family amidase
VSAALARCTPSRDGGAYAAIFDTEALEAAGEGRRPPGSLETITVGVKDMIAVRGHVTRAGSRTRDGARPEPTDAPAVAALRAAGAVLVGLTAMHELAFGVTGINAYTGTPANPADPDRIPGGSSSGSAVAVATGSVDVALGTDTGGSVRIPAALCGVVGYKPASGRFPTAGVLPLAPSLDHVGVLGVSVTAVAMVDRLFAPPDVPSITRPRRFGVDWTRLEDSEDVVADALRAAIGQIGRHYELVELRLPPSEDIVEITNAILLFEAARTYEAATRDPDSGLGDDVRTRLEAGLRIEPADYQRAREQASVLSATIRSTLELLDGFLEPTVPIVAPLVADASGSGPRLVAHTRLANATGLPAISLPLPVEGLPVGLQLTGIDSGSLFASAVELETLLGIAPNPGAQRTS